MRHDDHVTGRVVVVAVAVAVVFTSAAFASIIWHVMLAVMVCVPCLSGLAGWFLWLNRGGTWRPPPALTYKSRLANVSKPAITDNPRPAVAEPAPVPLAIEAPKVAG